MRTTFIAISALTTLFIALVSAAQQKSIQLPDDNAMATLAPGPGADVVKSQCSICHSTDYIVRQPHLGKQAWEAEVKKMVSVFGAPISESDSKVIANYLVAHYGTSP